MLNFQEYPGPRERLLLWVSSNPILSRDHTISQADLAMARAEDADEHAEFYQSFRGIVEEVVHLPPRSEADDILALKNRLENLYTRACGLQGDNQQVKSALKQLLQTMSTTLLNSAENEPEAKDRLVKDAESMQLHLEISEQPLVSGLLHEASPIPIEYLPALLLTETAEGVAAALLLFSPDQIKHLLADCRKLLEQYPAIFASNPEMSLRLEQFASWYEGLGG